MDYEQKYKDLLERHRDLKIRYNGQSKWSEKQYRRGVLHGFNECYEYFNRSNAPVNQILRKMARYFDDILMYWVYKVPCDSMIPMPTIGDKKSYYENITKKARAQASKQN